jgi:hypothetical protein
MSRRRPPILARHESDAALDVDIRAWPSKVPACLIADALKIREQLVGPRT